MVVQVVDSYSSNSTTTANNNNNQDGNKGQQRREAEGKQAQAQTQLASSLLSPGGSESSNNSKSTSPAAIDEDMSDSGEESASGPNKSEKSLSPEGLLHLDANSNASSRSSRSSAAAVLSNTNSITVANSPLHHHQQPLYCTINANTSPLRISAVKDSNTSLAGVSSEVLLLLSPPLPCEEAAEAESRNTVPSINCEGERDEEEDGANGKRYRHSNNSLVPNDCLLKPESSGSSVSPAHTSPLGKSPASNRSTMSASSTTSQSSTAMRLKRKHSMASSNGSVGLNGGEEDEEEMKEEEQRAGEGAAGALGTMPSSSGIEKRHKCDICGKGFPYMSILESHKRCHTGEKPFSCHFCDKKFAQKATLQVHERTHTGEKPYKCKYCEKTFAQYGTKTVHEKSAHLGIRNYKCPKCSKCLSSPSALYTHKKTHGDKSFQCNFCPKTFTLKNYLKLHIKQVHEHNERKHVCKFCSKTFAYAGSLQVHVRTHTGERPYICKFCPKAFASQGNLQSHERTHTGERPYTCEQCGRSFIQKSQLTAHEATHSYAHGHSAVAASAAAAAALEQLEEEDEDGVENHHHGMSEIGTTSSMPQSYAGNQVVMNGGSGVNANYRKQNEFVCKFCGKRYAYASSLYVHTRLHTGERPFRCNFCDKSFTNQGNMQVHQRVHTGEKPYKCEACGKSYAQKVGLKIHQEQCQVHLNRRGSVMTVGTNESESSPSVTEEELLGHIELPGHVHMSMPEDERMLHHATANESLANFLNGALKSRQQASLSSPSQTSSVFSSPIHSQRSSFSETFVGGMGGPNATLHGCPSSSASFFEAHTHPSNLLNGLIPPTYTGHNLHHNQGFASQHKIAPVHMNQVQPQANYPGGLDLLQSPISFSSAETANLANVLAAAITAPPTTPTTPGLVNGAHHSLASLLLEQLESQHQQQQQLAALKTLMELSSVNNSSSNTSGSNNSNGSPLAHPQPIYGVPPPPQSQVPHSPTIGGGLQYGLLNSQIHQQLLNQLLLQSWQSIFSGHWEWWRSTPRSVFAARPR